MKKSNLIFAIALCAIFFLSSLIQILPFEKDLGWAGCFAQSPNYLWAKSAGGTFDDKGFSCSTDASGNIIATGYFDSPSITFGSTTLTNAGGDDMFIVKLSGATGIEESNFENSFSVFPSPTSRYLTLTLSKGDETAEVEIYNISSQIMLKQPLIKKTTELDISGFSSGMYFVKIQNKENMKVCKVVKE